MTLSITNLGRTNNRTSNTNRNSINSTITDSVITKSVTDLGNTNKSTSTTNRTGITSARQNITSVTNTGTNDVVGTNNRTLGTDNIAVFKNGSMLNTAAKANSISPTSLDIMAAFSNTYTGNTTVKANNIRPAVDSIAVLTKVNTANNVTKANKTYAGDSIAARNNAYTANNIPSATNNSISTFSTTSTSNNTPKANNMTSAGDSIANIISTNTNMAYHNTTPNKSSMELVLRPNSLQTVIFNETGPNLNGKARSQIRGLSNCYEGRKCYKSVPKCYGDIPKCFGDVTNSYEGVRKSCEPVPKFNDCVPKSYDRQCCQTRFKSHRTERQDCTVARDYWIVGDVCSECLLYQSGWQIQDNG